jgi:hypothetical protein
MMAVFPICLNSFYTDQSISWGEASSWMIFCYLPPMPVSKSGGFVAISQAPTKSTETQANDYHKRLSK